MKYEKHCVLEIFGGFPPEEKDRYHSKKHWQEMNCPLCGEGPKVRKLIFPHTAYKCPCIDVVWHQCKNKPRGKALAVVTDTDTGITSYYEEGDMSQCTARRSSRNYKAMVAADNIEDARDLAHVLADSPILHQQIDVEDSAPLFTERTDDKSLRTNYTLPFVNCTLQQLKAPRLIFIIIDGVVPRRKADHRIADPRMLDQLQGAEVVFCKFQTLARDVDVRRYVGGRDKCTPAGWHFFATQKAITQVRLTDIWPESNSLEQRRHFGVMQCVNLLGDHELPPLPPVDAPEEPQEGGVVVRELK